MSDVAKEAVLEDVLICRICRGPLSPHARYGVCRRNRECRRVNDSLSNSAHRLSRGITPVPCACCGNAWIRRRGWGLNDKLCPECTERNFWCPYGAHTASLAIRVAPHVCRACRLLRHASERAVRLGLPFALTWRYVESIYPEICPYLGIRLRVGVGAQHQGSPTLDRIVPARGYVEGNVEVISYLANAMKNGATPEQLVTFARNVLGRFG